ncbi:hypothetical protein KZX45_13890 [Georgenia sp. EYE_87]|uniref:DUF6544 family protein n=1 Tax=Georgenia sp. EYE_87 TaxID=2853448 RepID=UPI002004F577|nr:DUF6544 family protein [Georgenia sp. EYE_87]MCK6211637.1 hypothetical protein [Georgenia sp. EYE_87]
MTTATRSLPAVPRAARSDWDDLLTPTPDPEPYDPAMALGLPAPARRWLDHAVAPGTPLRRRVEMRQHGQIRLGGRWWPIRSRQALDPLRGYVWPVRTSLLGVPLVGVDRLHGERAEMTHRLLGLVPVVRASGADLARSAGARAASEICWSPATALDPSVRWRDVSDTEVVALVPVAGEVRECTLRIDDGGVLRSCTTRRWARLDGGPWQWHTFGARTLAEGTFGGFTVPTRVVAGYGDDYAGQGAFIRLAVDDVVHR